jgi:hypothetical protein
MSITQGVKADERTAAVMRASNTWGLNVILYGLLIDIMYRSAVLHEAPWDLFALIGLSGAISMAYAARHKVLGNVFGWRSAVIMAVAVLAAAVINFILAMTRVR